MRGARVAFCSVLLLVVVGTLSLSGCGLFGSGDDDFQWNIFVMNVMTDEDGTEYPIDIWFDGELALRLDPLETEGISGVDPGTHQLSACSSEDSAVHWSGITIEFDLGDSGEQEPFITFGEDLGVTPVRYLGNGVGNYRVLDDVPACM